MHHILGRLIFSIIIFTTFTASGEANFLKNLTIHDKPLQHREVIFEDQGDKIIKLDSLGKNIVVLYFFASWCSDCIKELEQLEELQTHFKKRKLLIIPISEDFKKRSEVLEEIQKDKKMELIIYFDNKNHLLNLMNIKSIPTTQILNDDGDEIARIVGRANWREPYILNLLSKYIDKIEERH